MALKTTGVLAGIDVGATGIKVGLFDTGGNLVASASKRNGPVPQKGHPEWMVWDGESIWDGVCECFRELHERAPHLEVLAVSVDGFGADGAPFGPDGRQLYPFISWHCRRTLAEKAEIDSMIPALEVYGITGYHNYHINTLNRWLWLSKNEPEVMRSRFTWLMVQDYILYRLTGEMATEPTICSTMMALDLSKRDFSEKLLALVGMSRESFPRMANPGEVIGTVRPEVSSLTGIPAGTPVAAGGHDCEVGYMAAAVRDSETFVDITGTWEMVIADLTDFNPNTDLYENGIDYECAIEPGHYLCQSLMIAGGVVEWLRSRFYSDLGDDAVYSTIADEAAACPIGSKGVMVLPAFVSGMGPFGLKSSFGTLLGLSTVTDRSQIARAVFEGLCYQLKRQIGAIERNTGRRCAVLRTLGGGQKNEFWLQLKADITGRPVEVLQNKEITLMGSAVLAGVGAKIYRNVDEALDSFKIPVKRYEPDLEKTAAYEQWYRLFLEIPDALRQTYESFKQLTG